MPIQSINPTTNKPITSYSEYTPSQIEEKLSLAQETFLSWRTKPFAERKIPMLRLAEILKEQKRTLGEIMTREMGKPIKQAMAEVEKCALVCEYYAENAEQILSEDVINTEASESYVRFDPIGIVLAVMPWNFPFWQVFRFIAPAAMAGNVGVLKHASNVPDCALAIEKLFHDAGFPKGVFQTLLVGSGAVEGLINDDRIKAITLTGSEYAGSQVGMQAGREIKKTVLELGGSDPFIVFADANIEETAKIAATARLQNCGQSCISAKRFIVVQEIAEKFTELFKKEMELLNVGDPMEESTDVGPLYGMRGLEDIEKQVNESVAKGAVVVTGGKRLDGEGAFFAPTILSNVTKGMPAYDEEFFGPVASVIVAKDEDDAIRIANDTRFGLGSSLWTNDMAKAKKYIPMIDAGCVFVNSMVKSDPRLPFGGVKKSGYGRELSSYGIKEFVKVKTVWVQ